MIERHVVITNRLGLHARAAALLVRTANTFQSAIKLERMDGTAAADAKSILSVLISAAAVPSMRSMLDRALKSIRCANQQRRRSRVQSQTIRNHDVPFNHLDQTREEI